MSGTPVNPLLRHVRTLGGRAAAPPDPELLERYLARRDQEAFAALVARHGPMVLSVCRAVLRHRQDAEDAFQAAFLVLARRAAAIRRGDSLAGWLHGVARRVALKARAAAARRRAREAAVPPPVPPAPGDDLTWGELRGLLHEELARLPDQLRAPLLLCYVEGLTRDEAARRLGWPATTVKGRLDRGRKMLHDRLARRGLTLAAALAAPALAREVSAAVPAALAEAAVRAAAGGAAPAVASLADALLRRPFFASGKVAAAVVLLLGAVGAGAGLLPAPAVPPPAAEEKPAARARADPPPAAAPAEFDEVTAAITPSFLSNRTRETVRVSADGTCLYEVPGRPPRGKTPAWSGARVVHKLPAGRLRELNGLLKGTGWLAKAPEERPQLHHDRFEITLRRGGKPARLVLEGESEPYAKLLTFFRSVAAQEDLIYRLEWVPAAMTEARRELDNLVAAELGEPFARPPLAIDLTRYAPWATRQVRNPFGKSADDVRTAVRLVGLLKLESEREHLADLANDRDRRVRTAVAQAVGRLGGAKAVPVLRKMVRSTGAEAAWELIKLGPVAVPAIAEVIREGRSAKEDLSYEWLIRAYIEHWKDVPKPLDPRVVDAVRASMAAPGVRAHRTKYHAELLKLVAGTGRKE
jgi:RNA polymerase sigma factor (sigma-70 family)